MQVPCAAPGCLYLAAVQCSRCGNPVCLQHAVTITEESVLTVGSRVLCGACTDSQVGHGIVLLKVGGAMLITGIIAYVFCLGLSQLGLQQVPVLGPTLQAGVSAGLAVSLLVSIAGLGLCGLILFFWMPHTS